MSEGEGVSEGVSVSVDEGEGNCEGVSEDEVGTD